MTEYKQTLSGHFECNGFAAKLEGKHLSIEVVNDKIKVTYDAGVFTHDEINLAIKHVLKVNEIVRNHQWRNFNGIYRHHNRTTQLRIYKFDRQ